MWRSTILGGLCLLVSLAGSSSALAAKAGDGDGKRLAQRVLKAPAAVCPNADDADAPIAVQETAARCLLNYAREQAGLPRLDAKHKLDASAANKSADLLRCNQFSHYACNRDFLYWFRRGGYTDARCWTAGENLAWGESHLGSPRAVIRAWLRSPAHRANMLSADYREFGISLRVGSFSGSSDAHVWVNHFGRHC